jgi:hypothetical protein
MKSAAVRAGFVPQNRFSNKILFFIFIFFLFSCTSSKSRRFANEILSCKNLSERLKNRADTFQRVEGRAQGKDKLGSWQMLLSLRADRQFWIEIRSPLSGPFAILRSDAKWVEFLIPRRKELYRIPAQEFWQNSLRQKRFLEILPLRIRPEVMYDMLMGRLSFDQLERCKFSDEEQVYQVEISTSSDRKKVKIDPISFFPVQYGSIHDDFYVKFVGPEVLNSDRIEFGTNFEVFQKTKREFSFEWQELRWMSQLGDTPPVFPRSEQYKAVDY